MRETRDGFPSFMVSIPRYYRFLANGHTRGLNGLPAGQLVGVLRRSLRTSRADLPPQGEPLCSLGEEKEKEEGMHKDIKSAKSLESFISVQGAAIGALSLALIAILFSPEAAHALTLTQAALGPLFEPLNSQTPEWVRTLVWLNFRAAILLFVFVPLGIFFWSFKTENMNDAVRRIMVGYWQASSLLMLTVFLNIAQVPYAAVTGLIVQGMIPVSLYWWTDLVQEAKKEKSPLAFVFRSWQPVATVTSIIGLLIQIPFQGCNFVSNTLNAPLCAAWIEPPFNLHRLLFPMINEVTFGMFGLAGVATYASYLLWLILGVLPRVGRQGRKNRNCFSSVSVLKTLGWISKESPGN